MIVELVINSSLLAYDFFKTNMIITNFTLNLKDRHMELFAQIRNLGCGVVII